MGGDIVQFHQLTQDELLVKLENEIKKVRHEADARIAEFFNQIKTLDKDTERYCLFVKTYEGLPYSFTMRVGDDDIIHELILGLCLDLLSSGSSIKFVGFNPARYIHFIVCKCPQQEENYANIKFMLKKE